MSFLYPQVLFGLLALSIPIIIHLFNFRKTRKVYYSSTSFLHLVKEASTSKLKLKHLLILLARLLFIFFLVLAFAQPFIPARQQGSLEASEITIYLDNSLSMSNQVASDYSALDAGVAFINNLIDVFPQGTNYRFLTNDFLPSSRDFKSGAELSDLTTETFLSGEIRSAPEVWSRIRDGEESSTSRRKETFWIGDFQKSTLGDLSVLNPDSSSQVNLFPLGFESVNNLFVDSVFLDNLYFSGTERAAITVRVFNSGIDEASNVPMKIFLNNIQVSSATLSIPAGGVLSQKIDLGSDLQGMNTGRISIEDYPVTFDNDFYFTLDVSRKATILEIKETLEITAIESVFGNRELFSFNSSLFTNLDYSQINRSDLVILNELPEIDPSLASVLNEFYQNGGDLVIVPSVSSDLVSYQMLPGGSNLVRLDTLYRQVLNPPDTRNPFYENVFEDTEVNMAMPEATRAISWGTDRTAILAFRSGLPFLSRNSGSGVNYWFAGPLDDISSGFQKHALFVPVMYKIAFGSRSLENRLYYSIDEKTIELALDSLSQNAVIRLVSDESEFIPAQRITPSGVILELPPENLTPGVYRVSYEQEILSILAFNFGNMESRLDQYKAVELKDMFPGEGNVNVFDIADERDFARELRDQYKGTPLWKVAIILALAFVLAEALLIRFL